MRQEKIDKKSFNLRIIPLDVATNKSPDSTPLPSPFARDYYGIEQYYQNCFLAYSGGITSKTLKSLSRNPSERNNT